MNESCALPGYFATMFIKHSCALHMQILLLARLSHEMLHVSCSYSAVFTVDVLDSKARWKAWL